MNRGPAHPVSQDVTALRPLPVSTFALGPASFRSRWGSPRRRLRAAVGVLWLAAGALQLQPFMFTKDFSSDVLGSAAVAQPAPVHGLITGIEQLVRADPVPWNLLFAGTQLLVGIGLLLGRDGRVARMACRGSIAWGLGVWAIGEGFGGVLTGHAAASTGAPGAALLYVALTVAAWPKPLGRGLEAPLPTRLLTGSWLTLWLVGTALEVLPAQWGAIGLGGQAAMGEMMAPSWAVPPTLAVTNWLSALTPAVAAAVALALTAVLLALALDAGRRPSSMGLIAASVLAAVFWMFAQGFGGLSTGTATDVGTGPVIVAFALALWANRRSTRWSGRRPSSRPAVAPEPTTSS